MLITNLGKGGAQRVFHDHAIAFNGHFSVIEAVFNKAEDERIYNSGLMLYSLDVEGGNGVIQKLNRFFTRVKRLQAIVDKEGASLIISHMDGANWVNALSSGNAKKIAVVHGTVLHDQAQKKLVQWLRKKIIIPYLYKKIDLVVTVSEGIKRELEQEIGLKNVVAIPNYFDIDKIRKEAAMDVDSNYRTLFNQGPVLITSGRFAEQKKQQALIPVFKKVKRSYPNAKLIILGDGELRERISESVKLSGLSLFSVWNEQAFSNSYDVYMPGYVANPFAWIAKSTLFLFPSAWEGFPMALCEALICGAPVLSADCPTGPREILAPESSIRNYRLSRAEYTRYGVLLPLFDNENFITEWTSAIISLLANKEKRETLTEQAQQRMLDFDKQVIMQRWLDAITHVLS